MNNNNLINLKNRTKEERKKISSLGAIASAKVRKERKLLKDELIELLDVVDETGLTIRKRISIEVIKRAEKGDLKAFELIANITENKNQLNNNIKIAPQIIDDIK